MVNQKQSIDLPTGNNITVTSFDKGSDLSGIIKHISISDNKKGQFLFHDSNVIYSFEPKDITIADGKILINKAFVFVKQSNPSNEVDALKIIVKKSGIGLSENYRNLQDEYSLIALDKNSEIGFAGTDIKLATDNKGKTSFQKGELAPAVILLKQKDIGSQNLSEGIAAAI